jgi:hypothetical protein
MNFRLRHVAGRGEEIEIAAVIGLSASAAANSVAMHCMTG